MAKLSGLSCGLDQGRWLRPDIHFTNHDANSSGGLDYQEYAGIPWMNKWPEQRRKKLFDRIDRDVGRGDLRDGN